MLLRFAPEDVLPIKRLIRGIRRLSELELPLPGESRLKSWGLSLRMLGSYPELRFWSRMSAKEHARQFKNPLLRQFVAGGAGELSAIALVFALAWMNKRDAGYPIGGSRAVIRAIEAEFRGLGGRLRTGAKVVRILTENRRAVGVRLSNGEEVRADWVISAADGHSTIFDWVPEEFRDEKAIEPYRTIPIFPSYVQVSFGIRRDLRELPGFMVRMLREPIAIDPGTRVNELSFRIFHFDPTFAPAGSTAVTCSIPTSNDGYWMRLEREDPAGYAARKKEIADSVAQALERRLSGIRSEIEVEDVSTPATVVHFTGNWKGSMEGFLLTPGRGFRPLRMRLGKLERFRMIGQWVMPGGGLPAGVLTARSCIQEICRVEKRPMAVLRRGAARRAAS